MVMKHSDFLTLIKRVQALAQMGLKYTVGEFDRERYEELRAISVQMMHQISEEQIPKIENLFAQQSGYPTPMVDVRAVVMQSGKLLMVQESVDTKWALPGGWADIGYSAAEVAVKEVLEETGLNVEPTRLLAVWDKKCHDHPPEPYYVYKIFIQCVYKSGDINTSHDILDANYFSKNALPVLSENRNTYGQLEKIFELVSDLDSSVLFD